MSNFKDILIKRYGFSEAECELTFSFYKFSSLNAREFFCTEGGNCNKLATVKSGILRGYSINENGNEITHQFFTPNTVIILPESFNEQKPAAINIQAYTSCELFEISRNDYESLQEKIPEWQKICREVSDMKNQELMERNLQFQTLTAAERYQDFCSKHPELLQEVPLGHIASYLGMDIATLSRIRKK